MKRDRKRNVVIVRARIHSLRGVMKGTRALKLLEEERRKDREREDAKFR